MAQEPKEKRPRARNTFNQSIATRPNEIEMCVQNQLRVIKYNYKHPTPIR